MATSLKRSDFEITIICALPLEASAIKTILEQTDISTYNNEDDDSGAGKSASDSNQYTIGKIGRHNVVLVHMPSMGKISAAAAASNLKHSFRNIKLALLVGICGGVPKGDIRLGDVAIGKQVIQYDFGRQYPNGFKRKNNTADTLGRHNPEILAFMAKLESGKDNLEAKTAEYLTAMSSPEKTKRLRDDLFPPEYQHKHYDAEDCSDGKCMSGTDVCDVALSSSCEELKCDRDELDRSNKPKKAPSLHFGTIASGDTVMKSGEDRDKLASTEKESNIIAFEMEGAGVWDYVPCIVVKAICDYSDSHKNKKWQEYAATSAAASAKAILEQWSGSKADKPAPQQVSSF
ncbi:hypothetical protein ABW20_dc0107063 [Dactylellina cionopaga]|nr:hypothetical protein ABW20_dc0107063 [Dactylellina cionopaga]